MGVAGDAVNHRGYVNIGSERNLSTAGEKEEALQWTVKVITRNYHRGFIYNRVPYIEST